MIHGDDSARSVKIRSRQAAADLRRHRRRLSRARVNDADKRRGVCNHAVVRQRRIAKRKAPALKAARRRNGEVLRAGCAHNADCAHAAKHAHNAAHAAVFIFRRRCEHDIKLRRPARQRVGVDGIKPVRQNNRMRVVFLAARLVVGARSADFNNITARADIRHSQIFVAGAVDKKRNAVARRRRSRHIALGVVLHMISRKRRRAFRPGDAVG